MEILKTIGVIILSTMALSFTVALIRHFKSENVCECGQCGIKVNTGRTICDNCLFKGVK
jgi:predicted amidophosphoribosyltransferase